MFDIGFWELALIAVIGLIVLGPERLPAAARNLGLWAGRARMYVRNLRSELEREVDTTDLKRDIESARDEVTRSGRQLRAEVEDDQAMSASRDDDAGRAPAPDYGHGQQQTPDATSTATDGDRRA